MQKRTEALLAEGLRSLSFLTIFLGIALLLGLLAGDLDVSLSVCLVGVAVSLSYLPVGLWLRSRSLEPSRSPSRSRWPALWNDLILEELIRTMALIGLALIAVPITCTAFGVDLETTLDVLVISIAVSIAYLPIGVWLQNRREGLERLNDGSGLRFAAVVGVVVGAIFVAMLWLSDSISTWEAGIQLLGVFAIGVVIQRVRIKSE